MDLDGAVGAAIADKLASKNSRNEIHNSVLLNIESLIPYLYQTPSDSGKQGFSRV